MSQHLNGRRYLNHLTSCGTPAPQLGDNVVLALHPGVKPRRAKQIGGPFGSILQVRGEPDVITVEPLGPGAAVAAMTIEMLAALGVTKVVGAGVASCIPQNLVAEAGEVFVIENAVGDDLVPARYGGHSQADPQSSKELAEFLDAQMVTTFSTSTPFRVDIEAVLDSTAGVLEMEALAIFSAAAESGISASLAVVVSDITSKAGWLPADPTLVASRTAELGQKCRDLVRTLA